MVESSPIRVAVPRAVVDVQRTHRESRPVDLESDYYEDDDEDDSIEITPGAVAAYPGGIENLRVKGQLSDVGRYSGAGGMDIEECTTYPQINSTSLSNDDPPRELDAAASNDTPKLFFTKRELILSIVCLLLVVLPIGLGLGLTMGNEDPPASTTLPPTQPPSSPLEDFLRQQLSEFSLDGSTVWDDPQSPPNRAVQWLANNDTANWQNSTHPERLQQRYSLAVLYFATSADDPWKQSFRFLTDTEECTWNSAMIEEENTNAADRGVFCNDLGQVIEIKLGMYSCGRKE